MARKQRVVVPKGDFAVAPRMLEILKEKGFDLLSSFLQAAGPALFFIIGPENALYLMLAGIGLQLVEIAGDYRAFARIEKLIQILPELRDRLSNLDADVTVALRDVFNRAVNEPYNEKFRYFVEFLAGRMSQDQALTKDKHHRFVRWVEQLDLIALRSISRYKQADAQSSTYHQSDPHSVAFYESAGAGVGMATLTTFYYARDLVKDEPTSLWEFVAQLGSVGMVSFDRGGGGRTPGDAGSCLWHRDTAEFAEYLRKADARSIWQDEGEERGRETA